MGNGKKHRNKANKAATTISLAPAVPPFVRDDSQFPDLNNTFGDVRSSSPADQQLPVPVDGITVNGMVYYNVYDRSCDKPVSPIPCGDPKLMVTYRENSVFDHDLELMNAPCVYTSKELREAYREIFGLTNSFLFDAGPATPIEVGYELYHEMESTSGLLEGKRNTVSLGRKKTGEFCVLRQFPNFTLRNLSAVSIRGAWTKISHPNIVRLLSIFTETSTKSVFFAYEFCPNATTLHDYLTNGVRPVTEEVVWNFIIQILCALHAIHRENLAARMLKPTKILVTGLDMQTIKLNCVAVKDVIESAGNTKIESLPPTVIAEQQKFDFLDFGDVVQTMVEAVQSCSTEMRTFAQTLRTGAVQSFQKVIPLLGTKAFEFLTIVQIRNNIMESELGKEIENGRLFRLLMKLIEASYMAREVPSMSSDSGKIMEMFLDLLARSSMLDVVSLLNKLDAGVPELITLSDRTSEYSSIASFAELHQMFQYHATELEKWITEKNSQTSSFFRDSGLIT